VPHKFTFDSCSTMSNEPATVDFRQNSYKSATESKVDKVKVHRVEFDLVASVNWCVPALMEHFSGLAAVGQTLRGQKRLRSLPRPLFAALRQNAAGNFFKLSLSRTPDPIRPTRRGSDPNRPPYGSKEGWGLLSHSGSLVFISISGFWPHPRAGPDWSVFGQTG